MKPSQKLLRKLYSGDNRIRLLDQKYLPRWIVILIDTFLCMSALVLTYFILANTPINFHETFSLFEQALLLLGLNVLFFFIFKTFSGIIRHSTFMDLLKLGLSSVSTSATAAVISWSYYLFGGEKIFLTTSLILYMLISFFAMLFFRIAVKESYLFMKNVSTNTIKKRVAILGVDDHTLSVGRALTTEANLPYNLVGFLSKHFDSKRYKIMGKPVIPVRENLSKTLSELDIEGVLMVSEAFTGKERNELVETCLEQHIEVLNVPSLEQWNSKEDIKNQIKPIQIEDLLERQPISINSSVIHEDLQGKTILVTGGAGSIGSEIVRQIANFEPAYIIILDQAETNLHELELYLNLNHPSLNFITELADISNMYRLELLFTKYRFDVVYHAAAYKHVPLIERNPHEAIYVNILGTVNLSVLAVNHKIDKFVMVSTDKAVNPTNVMGASKRVAEMYVQSLQNEKDVRTRFITTRFGNVLGSSGSVIPHFRKQISQGGPVTVTHRDIIRYFMTIPEACQLVLQAGTMGKGGEIFVFDMGEPVRILSLAERMIKLSGLEPYEDIDIKITGLRPGEKLFEELLNDTSTSLPTHHPKIMISKVPVGEFQMIKKQVKHIIKAATHKEDKEVVRLLKELVPEFKSNNSEFEQLDQPKS
ncbi:polysaccharide biosynthesis protein [Altibacter sp. HG106]|uniref:polysaccharide biosynthesis protein n=1 Tax=Altibacter sp. HG106 TaxID=3023937 RepID=UPI00234FF805|nr:nucleoside-diphosphate sugar epimerase/dehydratase [Altibacter sp. HG106]MDC7995353.1 nucleoside-diphosphate sugar epimerase/dehydratase [Altibacter sp. HG106]